MSPTIAIIGATGTLGSRVVRRLTAMGLPPVQLSTAHGVDVVSGHGVSEALTGVDIVVDASNAFPTEPHMTVRDTLCAAARNVVEACTIQRVSRLAHMSLAAAHQPALESVPYFAAKRAQEDIVASSDVPSTVLRSTQWFEFAMHPSAVTSEPQLVVAEDWLIQPVAADSVAEVLIQHALSPEPPDTTTIGGPDVMRLPELTAQFLNHIDDSRPVKAKDPDVKALAEGDLLAPAHAHLRGPGLSTWLARQRRSRVSKRYEGGSLDTEH